MKILMATMGLDIGGAETHIVELSKQLKLQGHQVSIVSNGGVYVPEIEAAGIRHYQAPLNRRDVKDMLRARSILKEIIGKEKPDVVHAHARIPAMLCGTLKKSMGFPFVTSCHGVYHVSQVLKLLSDWGEQTLAVSEDVRDYLMEQYQIPAEQIALTINGIDTEKFSPKISGNKIREEFGLGEATVIGHVSRLDQASSLAARQLIELAPDLDKVVPGVRILITGGGDIYGELTARAAEINGQLGRDCLVLTGPRTDINELVAACDLFVGVSRAALEAMAACKCVVLSGAQGHTGLFVPDLLKKAVDTNFCCRTDPVATQETLMADITAALSLSAQRRQELGEYGRRVVGEYYSVARMTRDALEMYNKVRRRKYNVVMSGYYGFSNAGDDAILQSVHQSILEASDDVDVTVLSNDPEATQRIYGLKALHRFRLWSVFSALRKCDALLSGGGSLLQDRTSTRSVLYYLAVIRIAELMGKPVMLYANGIGPVEKPGNRKKVSKAVERAALVTLRDSASAQELRDMGVKREDLYVTADPVFRLNPAPEERCRELLKRSGLQQDAPFVAVSVRDWPDTEQFNRELAVVCDHLHRKYGLEVLFVLMQPHKDRQATGQVRQAMQENSYILEESCSPDELMGVLGQAKLCLAMRLHTLIFAARVAVPVLGLVYDPKVESYLQELDMPSAGHVNTFDSKYAIVQVDELMKDYTEYRQRLVKKADTLSDAARRNEQLLLELLEKSK